jgi:eukaryotic-like serine/threonine-protein kinase
MSLGACTGARSRTCLGHADGAVLVLGILDITETETRLASGPAPDALLRWGPFEDLRRVGRGSFGEVYRAFDPDLQRHVALKLLFPGGGAPEDERAALLREARAIARVRHPNVLLIHGVDRHDGRVGFWTDFVNGQTLGELVGAQGTLGAREAALIGVDVCRAVAAVHAAGLLHRDIKAGNVMREEGGRILLMDFGLTHEHGDGADGSGTPVYMAPEVALGGAATIASDIYAIGVLLFYLLTKQYPVEGATFEELRQAHAEGRRRALLDARPDLPEPLARVVETAISPTPEKRFASTGQLISALTEAAGLGSAAAAGPAAGKRLRLRSWMLAPVVLGVALLPAVLERRAVPSRAESLPLVAGEQEDYRRAHELLAHYYRPGALETSIPLLEQIAARDARFAPALADLGRANFLQFSQQRDTRYLEPARNASLRALAVAPDLASAHVTLGFLYAFTDQNDLAAHEIDTALRLDRLNAAAYGALAELQSRQGRTELVEDTLQKAVGLAPDDWLLNMQLGAHYLDRGDWARAAAQFRHTIDLVPDNPRAHNNLGLVYRSQGKLDEAAAAFQKAIDLEPTFLHFRNLGMVLAEAGRPAEAEQALDRAIQLRPSQYRAWGLLASVYASRHADEAKVRAAYLKAIALSADLLKQTPKDEYLLADVGTYYAALKKDREGLPLLAQAAALAPENPEVLYQVAVGYEMLHRRDEALHWLGKARAGGYPAEAIARNPVLAALRTDPRYALDTSR